MVKRFYRAALEHALSIRLACESTASALGQLNACWSGPPGYIRVFKKNSNCTGQSLTPPRKEARNSCAISRAFHHDRIGSRPERRANVSHAARPAQAVSSTAKDIA